jgi:hypothetical protein
MDLLILKAKSWLTRVHKNIGPKRPNLQPKYLLSGVMTDVYINNNIYMYNKIHIIIKTIYYIYNYIYHFT